MRTPLLLIVASLFIASSCHQYDTSRIFAHNDYARPSPFHTAYDLGVGYIEADVFLVGDTLMVAHEKSEIQRGRTLHQLYLEPLAQKVKENNGSVYQDESRELTLMIDLKTGGAATMEQLVEELQQYPGLISCQTLHFMVSGSMPSPSDWKDYPSFITFDGRPGIAYTPEQLARIPMISTSFRDHVEWDGHSVLSDEAVSKITALVDQAHSKGKKMRFWATPDTEISWKKQMELGFDVVLTDDVKGLAAFMER